MKNKPLLPVRRVLNTSMDYLKTLSEKRETGPTNERNLRFENLEDRRVLSATGLDPGHSHETDSGYFTGSDNSDFGFQQDDSISYLKVLVNGEEQTLGPNNNVLNLVAGDSIEVIEIGIHSEESEGVFAAEGYLNKIGDLTSASMIDYNDGRFSDREDNFEATGADGFISGLQNQWEAEAGWDRMTINLMHYTETSTEVAGRFFVNMQVGLPDFELDTAVLDTVLEQEIRVGDEVSIAGSWLNNQSGLFHNYAEVDIYHDCDPEAIIWAGALVGNAGDSVEGEFINTRDNDPFTERWIPDAPGEYILKYYVDPEDVASESNEENNQYEIRLTVLAKEAPIAVDDAVVADGSAINVMENDIPTHESETLYSEDFEATDSLAWTVNPNGTDTATSGLWEATDPVGTSWNGVELQLEDAANGQQSLVTGGHDDGSVGYDDVDGGITSAISEALSVPADSNAELSFKYNFAHLNNSSSEDFFRVSVVSENSTQIVLEERGGAEDKAGQWVDFSISLADFAGQEVQIMVEAGDLGSGSLVEAGIDDVAVAIPETPMKINEFTQAENGTVSLNDDGTFNYTANPGFSGEDSFTYSLTDGENTSNDATVSLTVDAANQSAGNFTANDDLVITFTNESQYAWGFGLQNPSGEQVDQWAVQIENANYTLDAQQLTNQSSFDLTSTENADGTFNHLFVGTTAIAPYGGIQGGNIEWSGVNFGFEATSDGFTSGTVTPHNFADVGILTGTSGPFDTNFLGFDGSESAITFAGLPSFVKLSAGSFDGQSWILAADDLEGLQMKADLVSDTSGWTDYQGSYAYKNWNIKFSTADIDGQDYSAGSFDFTTWQKTMLEG